MEGVGARSIEAVVYRPFPSLRLHIAGSSHSRGFSHSSGDIVQLPSMQRTGRDTGHPRMVQVVEAHVPSAHST